MRPLRQMWAIAVTTFREAVRMKAFVAPAAFAVTAIAMAPFLPSDGTAAGAVRLSIKACLITASIFVTLAGLMLASLLPAREARDRTGYLVATKPVRPWAVFAGRTLGLWLVVAAMAVGMAVLSWGIVRATAARAARRSPGQAGEVAEALTVRGEVQALRETGALRPPAEGPQGPLEIAPGKAARWRFSLAPGLAGASEIEGRLSAPRLEGVRLQARNPASGEVRELRLEGPARAGDAARFVLSAEAAAWPAEGETKPGEVVLVLANVGGAPLALEGRTPLVLVTGSVVGVPAGGRYEWEFVLPPGLEGEVAFRARAARTSSVQRVTYVFEDADGTRRAERVVLLSPRGLHTMKVEASELPAGALRVALVNGETPGRYPGPVRVPVGRGLVYAPRSGALSLEMALWALLESVKVAFVVLVVSAAATRLTFPVPALVGGAVVAAGYLVAFLVESGSAFAVLGRVFALAVPDFTAASTASDIAEGALTGWGRVASTAASALLLRGVPVALAGAYLSSRREVGA